MAAGSSTNSVGDLVADAGKGISDNVAIWKTKAVQFVFDNGPKLLTAIVIVVVGYFVARSIDRLLAKTLAKKNLEPPVRMLISRIVRLLVIGMFVVVALGTAGVNVTALVAGIGVAGVGVGLATQGVLSNLVAGLTIIFTKPFRVGEYIELLGVQGQVQSIELFSTTLLHADLSKVVIPNRKIVGEILHNYHDIRQLDLSITIASGANLAEVLTLLQQILADNSRVLKNPAPGLGVSSLTNGSISIAIKPWAALADFGPAGGEIYQTVLDRFRAHNIVIPPPRSEVKMIGNS